MKVMLSLLDGSRCCLHAVLERDPINTITLHLLPGILVVNRSSITLQLLTRLTENMNGQEGVDREQEMMLTLPPSDVGLLPQNEVCLISKFAWLVLTLYLLAVSPAG